MKRAYDLYSIRKLAKSRGGKFLSDEYTTLKKKYLWECSLGHRFYKTAESIRYGQWCRECSDGLYERLCRSVFESFFKAKFPKRRDLDWLKSANNTFLELDGYNEKLKIAFEHQGGQHFGDERFFSLPKYDALKRKLCKKNKIVLIEIPELYTRLKLKDLPSYINNQLIKRGVRNFESNKIEEIDFSDAYSPNWLRELKLLAKPFNGKLINKYYLGAQYEYTWQCHRKHSWKATKYTIHHGCPHCRNEVKVLGRYFKNFETACIKHDVSYQSASRRVRIYKESPDQAIRFLKKSTIYKIYGKSFKTKVTACGYFNIKEKSVDNFCRKNKVSFEEAVKHFINAKVVVFGKTFDSVKQVAKFYNTNEEYLYLLKKKNRLTTEAAINKILDNRKSRKVRFQGKVYENFSDFCRQLGISRHAMNNQMKRKNLSLDEAAKILIKKQRNF